MATPPGATRMSIRRLAHGEGLAAPGYQTPGAAGLDLPAALEAPLHIEPGARALVPTGFAVEIPEGFEGQVRPRSGLAVRKGLTVLNAPGTIDSDYRGELRVILVNLGAEPVVLERGDRVAQLVIAPIERVRVEEIAGDAHLSDTVRGEGGFGHTG